MYRRPASAMLIQPFSATSESASSVQSQLYHSPVLETSPKRRDVSHKPPSIRRRPPLVSGSPQKRRNIQLVRPRLLHQRPCPGKQSAPRSPERLQAEARIADTRTDSPLHSLFGRSHRRTPSRYRNQLLLTPRSISSRQLPPPRLPRAPQKILVKHRSRHRNQLRRSNSPPQHSLILAAATASRPLAPSAPQPQPPLHRHSRISLSSLANIAGASASRIHPRPDRHLVSAPSACVASASIRSRRSGISCLKPVAITVIFTSSPIAHPAPRRR